MGGDSWIRDCKIKIDELFLGSKRLAKDKMYIEIEEKGIKSFQRVSAIGHLYKIFLYTIRIDELRQ